jgi:glycosyltransferase involved in cell wall biosynthesis/tetratricopeptide (TPR) repeat protein
MIVKNEARTLKACLDSVVPFVSEVIIGLGGKSDDNTLEIIQEWNKILEPGHTPIQYFEIEWENDFAAARQQVLDKCTGEYFLWIDGDDTLVGGERMQALIQLNPNIDAFYFGYDYSQDENGRNNCYLVRERLVIRHPELSVDWKWVGKVHEVLIPQFPHDAMKVEDIVVVHHKPPNKHEADRNVSILYQQLRETEPNPDPRILVYLGSENLGRGNLQEAILHLQRFVKLSGWDEEKYQAQVRISHAWRTLGDNEKALRTAQDAIAMLPNWPDAYLSLAKTYASMENWKTCLEYLKVAVQKPKPQTMLIINPLEYTYEPSLMIALAYTQLGDLEVALQNYQNAYGFQPDPKVADQIRLITQQLEMNRAQQAFFTLREYLGRHDEWLKVRKLFDVVPKSLEQSTAMREVWERSMQQTGHIIDPQIMVDFYNDNPHWQPMEEDRFKDPAWLDYPRMRFALEVARRVNAKTIVDWGCSDGFISLPLAKELGVHVTGFDLDPRCIDLASLRGEAWGTDTRFEVGNVDEVGGWEGDKADLAIFFEILEHVVDPVRTLARLEMTAKHIAMTTPYLAWESGNIPAWDKLEPKGHLRIFDQYDVERLLTGRGQIMNIYREPWGPTGWIFADYAPGVQLRNETIIIGAQMGLEEWGPRKLATGGLGGSETAVIRLAEAFAKKQRRPIVYNPVDEPGYYNGVCYRPVNHFRPEIYSDLYIAWRMPEAADLEINTKHLSLWFHDTDSGDRLTKQRAKQFDSFVVLSEWHREHLLKTYPFINPEKVFVIGNGVDLSRFDEPVKRDKKKVIYSSSPDRGLDIILESIWPKVVEAIPDAELHVYYGWDSYDKASQLYDGLKQFRSKMDQLFLDSKNVVQHGRIPQDRLAKEMQEASIWLYPTYFSETYCITAVEAQLAGALPITNKLAALAETVQSGITIEGDVHDSSVQQTYVDAVIHVLEHSTDDDETFRQEIKKKAPARTWDQVAESWEQFLKES